MKTLIVGFGNPMRSDDGIGPRVVQEIETRVWPGVETQIYQQLNLELAEELTGFDRVVFVDASENGPDVHLREVNPKLAHENISSHYFRPELLLAITQQIYGRGPDVFLCSIRGENFELGETVSSLALKRAERAVQKISHLIFKSSLPREGKGQPAGRQG